MNRSKTDISTTARRQWRAGGVCQESKRTTTTTEPESDESLVSTVKNSTLAREAALGPIEEQSNSPLGVQQCSSGPVRNCSAANDYPPTMAERLKKGVLSMLNPLATAFRPAASGPNGGGGAVQFPPQRCSASPSADQTRERLGDARGAADSAPTKFRIEEEDVRLSVLSSVSPAAKHSPSIAINSTGAFTGCPADRHSSHDLQRGSDSRGSGPSAQRQIDAQNCREGIPVPPPVFAPAGPAALCDNAATSAERL